MRGIYKRGNIWWIRYADNQGEIIFKSSGSSDFKEAEMLLLSRKNHNASIGEEEILMAEQDMLLDALTLLANRTHDNLEILDCIDKIKQYCNSEMAAKDALF